MLNARQAASLRDDSGAHLPKVWEAWANLGVAVRRGHVHLIAASPGGYKSVVATNLAIKQRVGCLYLGMDIDPNTWSSRALQMLTHQVAGAEEAVLNKEQWALDTLAQIPWVKLAFPDSPDIDEIVLRVFAYAEAEGEFPQCIVVDNLMDIDHGQQSDSAGHNFVMNELAKLARLSKAAVIVLAHVTGEYEDGHTTIPQSGLMNKIAKKPTLVVTLCRGGLDNVLYASIVKNRYGKADPSGVRTRAELRVYPEMMVVIDP